MQCIGQSRCRFAVLAGPDACADQPEAIHELIGKAAEAAVYGIRAEVAERTKYRFEIDAATPEQACEIVTVLFRSVYGLNWWAEVSPIRGASFDYAEALSWN
jgi:hypothetical protein